MGIRKVIHRFNIWIFLEYSIVLLWLPLAGCSGGSVDDGGEGPRIDVSFPLSNSNLAGETDRITLRGRAVAANGARVSQVLINNLTFSVINAKPPPDLPNGDSPTVQFDLEDPTRWSTQIALVLQENDIVIQASDDRGHSRTKELTVRNGLIFSQPTDVVLDVAANRALVVDESIDALLAVDLSNGSLNLISGLSTGAGPAFYNPRAVALDASSNRVLVVDEDSPHNIKALMAVDLTSGDRSVISDAKRGNGPEFSTPGDIALDTVNNRVLLVNRIAGIESQGSLMAVNLSSGDRSVISDSSRGSGTAFISPSDVVLDASNNRTLVVDWGLKALLAVDLSSGDRQVISDENIGIGPIFDFPFGMALEASNNRALVVNQITNIDGGSDVLSVDLSSGNRSVISGANTGTGPVFGNLQDIVVDTLNTRALVVDGDVGLKALVEVDLANGKRSVISSASTSAVPAFTEPLKVALDSAKNRALVVDKSKGYLGLHALLEVDLSGGGHSAISDANTGAGPAFIYPRGLAFDPAVDRALVVMESPNLKALLAVDLTSGDRRVISDASRGAGPVFVSPSDLALDAANNRVLVVDEVLQAILEVDLSNGDRRVISDANTGVGPMFISPSDLALDAVNNLVLVLDVGALLAVDLASGSRIAISDTSTDAGPKFNHPVSVALDTANNTALVVDWISQAVLAVDLATGARRVISDSRTGVGPEFDAPADIVLDIVNNRAFVVDAGLAALLAVDLPSGDRVIVLE